MQIFWYDYETSGRDAAADRPVQLGWQITDPGMEPQADAASFLIRLPDDVLPSAGALLVHQIAPELHQKEGVSEAELAVRLEDMITPRTLVAGYNSRAFDDKFTQHVFYRCLRDPYAWQYADGRGRFDLYPVVLAYFVFAPEAIRWPEDQDGRPRFKLDRIGPLNQLDEGLKRSHDAAGDVAITARLGRRLARHDPDLFASCLKRIDKHFVTDKIRADGRSDGLLEVTAFAGWDQGYVRDLWIPFRLAKRSNDYVGFDLNRDPKDVMSGLIAISEASDDDLASRRRRARELGLHTVRINAQPMLFRRNDLSDDVNQRLSGYGRNVEQQNRNLDVWHQIQESSAFKQLYQLAVTALEASAIAPSLDVDFTLYSGSFLSTHDRGILNGLPLADPTALADLEPAFEDLRYTELLFRFRARNFPQSLTQAEWRRWQGVRREKLMGSSEQASSASRIQEELLNLGRRDDLEPYQAAQLQQFLVWLDNQPPI